jgi:hypothetical protein
MATKQATKNKQIDDDDEQIKLKHVNKNGSDDEYEYVTVPPDGGFGWVVAFAAMVYS